MKKTIVSVLMLASVLSTYAQTAAQKACIEKARTAYATALERVAMEDDEPHYLCGAHIITSRNNAGIGIQKYDIDFRCCDASEEDEGEKIKDDVAPYFMRLKWNVAAREYTQEFVYGENDNPRFMYLVGPDDPINFQMDIEDGKFESRIYFDDKGKFSYGYNQVRLADGKITNKRVLKATDKDVIECVKMLKKYTIIGKKALIIEN